MSSPSGSTTTLRLQRCLDRLHAGDEQARKELIDIAFSRLTCLVRKMFKAEQRVQRWEQFSDVFQSAMLRFYRALQEVTPTNPRDFYQLASLQIRRELIDLARHHYGRRGQAAGHENGVGNPRAALQPLEDLARSDDSQDPSLLACWSELHQQAETLPAEVREVFELLWYQGLTHAEAAALLNISTKTVQRRWHAACLQLYEALEGCLPEW